MRRPVRYAIAFLVAAIAVFVVISLLSGSDKPAAPAARTVTLGGPGHDTVALPPVAQKIVAQQAKEDAAGKTAAAESDLNVPPPPPAVVEKSKALTPPGQPTIPAHVPLATASTPGCATRLVRNFSSRRGAPVLLGVIHWTGSRPTPGSPAGGRAIVSWFDRGAAQASSNEITDPDGRCWLVVPESQKAWTQANFNPWAVSVEIVNQGVQPLFPRAAGRAAVIRLMRGWHNRWKIPYRRARVTQAGCRVIRSGFLAHRDLGRCGGGHPDVGTFALDALIREAGHATRPVSPVDRRTCARLNAWRHAGRPAAQAATNVRRRDALAHRHVRCTGSGPVRIG